MIIQRYLTKEVVSTLLSVTLILLFIFVSNQFVRYLGDAAAGKLLGSVLFRLMLFQIPYLLGFLLPLGLFLGILLSYGRLYSENEMTALASCGFSRKQLIKASCWIALGVTLVVSFLTLWLGPRLLVYKDKLIAESQGATVIQTLMPGRFQADASGHQVYYVEEVSRDHEHLNNIFVAQQKKEEGVYPTLGQWTIIAAQGGYVMRDQRTQDQFLVATKGFRYMGTPGSADFHIGQFEEYGVRIATHELSKRNQVEELSFKDLLKEVREGNPLAYAESQWRFAMPLATLLLALLAVPLSELKPRQGRYAKIFPSLLIFMVYANMLFVSRTWLEKGTISPWLGTWMIHGALLLLVIVLLLNLPQRWQAKRSKLASGSSS
ncbi:MAG: LPS export ABC transporter permease LptF [Gammaproteobacteria bacterium]|nr:LPS export ABC transporter permease LptF [Gammaproteobacteria bacterium]